jgi:hypothetical protein
VVPTLKISSVGGSVVVVEVVEIVVLVEVVVAGIVVVVGAAACSPAHATMSAVAIHPVSNPRYLVTHNSFFL